ncbi:MAG: putative toxin-antitoxin system toxin component, PIN family [Acidobacteriota bacterium]
MAKPAVVLDTNIVVSAHLVSTGLERRILDLALSGQIRLCLSEEILEEYEAVLRRPKFAIAATRLTASLREIKKAATFFASRSRLQVASDPADNKFIECAESSAADYLITGNKRHFPSGWKSTNVVSSREFLQDLIPELRI